MKYFINKKVDHLIYTHLPKKVWAYIHRKNLEALFKLPSVKMQTKYIED